MKYYKEKCPFQEPRDLYVISRCVGFGYDDNHLGAMYDKMPFDRIPTIHGKLMKNIINRTWKVFVHKYWDGENFSNFR